ncbi:MAG: hypothetical protein EHM42_03855 [Planctomycetaceae bacterium]|nr:MAG: hypothetical protein EHM42_03855 [Planctomycetaceae bacterium]
MPGFLLHQGATVLCQHGGQGQAVVPNPRVKVSNQMTVQQPIPWLISGCPFVAALVPLPCVLALWTSAATRVRSGGLPLLLQDSQATCLPIGTPVNIPVVQTRVKAQ